MREIAYAKLNLALHVRGREADGYHRIETIFAFCEEGDVLRASTSERPGAIELEVSGPFAAALGDGEDNLVTRATRLLRDHYGVQDGVCLHLDKNLPVAAGLGGGSADAAAALRLLARWWHLPHEPEVLHDIARRLGADVPACLESRTVRGTGRGDQLEPVAESILYRPVLLVNPRVPVPTASVFAGWDGVDRGPLGDWRSGRNDLEAPARRLARIIGEVLEALAGASIVRMSGSGATCFGVYLSGAYRDEAASRIAAEHPDWWLLKTRLGRPDCT
jgi:4-diphosphocytidyl-2-C-methyl-D-erythritol kinase